ncbi:MAG: hypothetical protein R3293_21460 [Candidatus Promineifilaceae bacterium]|nr:hypothetical protein [Candidatus Promineifilaceae bacterium]
MNAEYRKLPWNEPGWLEKVEAWIDDRLAGAGRQVIGPVEILHQRPWATFAQINTDQGPVYFKAPAPPFYEAPLTQALARWRPDLTVELLAVDLERGWLLSAAAGETIRSADNTAGQVDHWLKIVPINAELQKTMAERRSELLAMGLPDRTLAKLPALYNALLQANENLRIGRTPGLTPEEYHELRELRPRFAAMCAELAGYGIPDTLCHEEVHDANILIKDGRYIFTDWSDSSFSFPFFSNMITIRAAAYRLGLDEHGADMARIRDAYLEPWTDYGTRAELSRAYDLARILAMANRALSWNDGTGALAPELKEPYADAVPEWLQDFLAEMRKVNNSP